MISVQEALDIITNQTENFGSETVDFIQSHGRFLKEQIFADRDFPPFNRVCMDGVAISSEVFKSGKRDFVIEGIQAAGSPKMALKNSENCLEVMTGAILPEHTDVVIPYEQIEIKKGIATVELSDIRVFQNIHLQGKDRKKGDLLIDKDRQITAAEIGLFATVGKSKVLVAAQPKIMIVSTGDELVEVSSLPLEHQIRKSNVFSLVSLLKRLSIDVETAHITDDKVRLKEKIKSYLQDFDVLLFSGAVSKGKFDFLPEVLEELGVKKCFHKVKQRPGKPFWFGKRGNTTIFAFPGNPVSTYVNCLKYFYPWYKKSIGLQPVDIFATLSEAVVFKPDMTLFLQVKLAYKNNELTAIPVSGNGSGDLANLADADAFVELPSWSTEFKKGMRLRVLNYRMVL